MNTSLEIRRLTFEPGVPQVLSPPALDVLDPVDHDGAAEDVRKAEDVKLKEKKGENEVSEGNRQNFVSTLQGEQKGVANFPTE